MEEHMILKPQQQAGTPASRRMSVAHIVGLVLAAAAATSAFAQEPVEEVTVTGSRIRQNPLEARSPVQVLSSEEIESSGFVALGDYLQSLPIAGSSINRTNN